jgi:hypothetical protein
MRTLSIGGLLNVMYFNFFSSHPYTYFSHVNIINFFTGIYPYGNKGLGQVVGSYFLSDDLNANANFWATDGIASLGVVGILLISILVYYFLVLINGVSKGLNIVFVSLVFIPLIGSLLNTSFFSTLLTGGGFLLIFSLMFIEKSQLNT